MIWHDNSSRIPASGHMIFGGSNKAWHNYSEDDVIRILISKEAAKIGTVVHEWVDQYVKYNNERLLKSDAKHLRQKLLSEHIPEIAFDIQTLFPNVQNYVNDAIKYNMRTEEFLYVSDVCGGTADAIMFDEDTNILRVHDLKTGVTPASMDQLYSYVAFFCLEYGYAPGDLRIETRIYQNNEVIIANPTAEDILPIMDQALMVSNVAFKTGFTKGGF